MLGMRMTAFEDVSLRALMLLSAVDGSEPLATRAIAEGVGTPYNHVSKAVLKLRELGLVESTRGRAGGVQLSAAGRRATVGGVLRALDTRNDLPDCESPNGDCPLNHDCGLRGALRRAREAFYRELDTVSVSSLPHPRQMGPVLVQIGLRPVFGSDGETGSTASDESSEGSAFFEGAAALLPAPDAV
jgi:Rrf2 family nitric oxide-sensitive transcriptional repressor